MSRSNVPMLADVIVHYDSLNHEYSNMAEDEGLPLWGHAANRARLKLNKYYAISDSSHLYRLAILLHPSNRQAYLARLDWKHEWIEEASDIALDYWTKFFYKPDDYGTGDDVSSQSQFGYSSFADNIYGSLADKNDKPVDPVTSFITDKPTLERTKGGRVKPVNPLAWWYAQRLAGDEHCGLTQMALDVLGAPATSVDVERAFSFVSNLVSKRRHRMSTYTIQSTASLGAYSRANLVPVGSLAKAHHRAREKAQANARAKAAKAKLQAAEAEAAALAAGVESAEESEDDGTDKELDPLDIDVDIDDLDD
ncbi:hAT family dimerization protein [Ceratobasidium sp. AG-Ba]|nr:hAT family dimerization protein [Ceratobasidium sp. AG-Ba]